MVIPEGVIASINTNHVDISSGWLWSTAEIYSLDYNYTLTQPVSVEAIVLNELRFLASTSTLTIRRDFASNAEVLWAGDILTVADPAVTPAPGPSSEYPSAPAAVSMVKDTLVAMTPAGLIRADATLGLETVGLALNSANVGEMVEYSTTGVIDVLTAPYPAGTILYLGSNGNSASTPVDGSILTQRVGTATSTGIIVQVQQPLHLTA